MSPPSYPGCTLTRRQAALDLLLIVAALIVGQLLLATIALWLMDAFPSVGVFALNLILGILTLISVGLVLYCRRQPLATIGLGRPRWRRTLLGVLAAVPACYCGALACVAAYLMATGTDLESLMRERGEFFEKIPDLSLAMMLPFTLFVGLHEEILFRGFILTRLNALFRSPAAAIVVSSLVFGSLHFYQGPIGVVQTTAVGLILAILVTVTRTLWPAILAHTLFDTIGLMLIPLLRDQTGEIADALTTAPAG